MERLTEKHEADAQRKEYERRLANGYPRNIPEERFLRLAAYEDTHMMPADVMSMRMDMAIITAFLHDCDVDRLRELAEADKDGRVDGDTLANIAEELADVGIMLDQMAIEFEVEYAVAEQRAFKVRRLRERIEKDD